jgi:hypothetical protein
VRQSFPPKFCRLISSQTLHVQNSCVRAIPRPMSDFGSNGAASVLVPHAAEGAMAAIAAPILRRTPYAQILCSFAPAPVPEPESINQ